MTNTKKIRILNDYIEKGLGEQVVLKIHDRWDFDPEVMPRTYALREQYTVSDALKQYQEQKGYVYEGITFKELQKCIDKNMPFVVNGEFPDTKEKFFQEHPNFFEEQKKKLNGLLGLYNRYKSQFI